MSVAGAAVVFGLAVFAMVKWNAVRPFAAAVCVIFGLVLGATAIGDAVNSLLTQFGAWIVVQVGAL